MAFSSFSERDALLENDSEHHVERSIPIGMEASTSSNHASSSSSFASRITTKSFALGVAGMVLFAYGGHTVKQKMLGAEHGGDAVRFYRSTLRRFRALVFSLFCRGGDGSWCRRGFSFSPSCSFRRKNHPHRKKKNEEDEMICSSRVFLFFTNEFDAFSFRSSSSSDDERFWSRERSTPKRSPEKRDVERKRRRSRRADGGHFLSICPRNSPLIIYLFLFYFYTCSR